MDWECWQGMEAFVAKAITPKDIQIKEQALRPTLFLSAVWLKCMLI